MNIPIEHLMEFVDLCAKEYQSWTGDDNWDVFRFEQQGVQLMVAHRINGDKILVVFRGTDDHHDIRIDVNILHRRLVLPYEGMEDSPVRVHSGFITGWKRVRDEVIPYLLFKYEETSLNHFIFVGHSLGGALAQLASLDFQYHMGKLDYPVKIACVTFGAPRVGNAAFKVSRDARVPDTLNLVNENDPIFYQPWRFLGYHRSGGIKQVGQKRRIWIPSFMRINSHYMRGYQASLDRLLDKS